MPNHYTVTVSGFARFDEAKGERVSFDGVPSNLCEAVRPMPEEAKGQVPGLNPPWYQFATEEWGTKWGTYQHRVHRLEGDGQPVVLEFQCAWGPPNEECCAEIRKLLEGWFESQVWVGHDPFDDSTQVLWPRAMEAP